MDAHLRGLLHHVGQLACYGIGLRTWWGGAGAADYQVVERHGDVRVCFYM